MTIPLTTTTQKSNKRYKPKERIRKRKSHSKRHAEMTEIEGCVVAFW